MCSLKTKKWLDPSSLTIGSLTGPRLMSSEESKKVKGQEGDPASGPKKEDQVPKITAMAEGQSDPSECEPDPTNTQPEDDEGGGEDRDDPLVIDEADEKSEGADSDEKEFEPTIDMIMNDFDDERTMEEEEALEAQDEDDTDELSALEHEQDMPLEELLKLYNYGGAPHLAAPAAPNPDKKSPAPPQVQERLRDVRPEKLRQDKNGVLASKPKSVENSSEKRDDFDEEEAMMTMDGGKVVGGEKRRSAESPPTTSGPQPNKKSRSELARFYEATVEGRALRSTSGGQTEDVDEDESDGEDSVHEGSDYSWKKTIMIGPSYQASVPPDMSTYGDTLPYENEDKKLWDPNFLPIAAVEDYLSKSEETLQSSGLVGLPQGAHIRDDEQVLFLLLQCGYNCEEALRRRRMNAIPPADTMSLWSEEECRAFELGLRLYGKDFHMIQQQKVRTRSVGELVQFYYLWKKTERHDVFANSTRLEKKKYTLHPGTTDYMDRFIDDQDPSRDRSSSPTYHSLIFTDTKKGLSLHPGANKSPGVSNGDNSAVISATPTIIATSLIPANPEISHNGSKPEAPVSVLEPPPPITVEKN